MLNGETLIKIHSGILVNQRSMPHSAAAEGGVTCVLRVACWGHRDQYGPFLKNASLSGVEAV